MRIREKHLNQKAITLWQTLLTVLRRRQIPTTVNILLKRDGWKYPMKNRYSLCLEND